MALSVWTWLFALSILLSISLSGCSSMLYAPTNDLYASPKAMGLVFDEVKLTSDSHSLYGWRFRETRFKKPKGWILFFHGNGQNRSSHFLSLVWMLDRGYDYFIFDYQGYGESDGKPSPEGTVDDGIAALNWFFETAKEPRYQGVPMIVFAQSLGGAVALRSLEEYTAKTSRPIPALRWVVLDSSFLSYQRATASVLSKHWITFLFQPLSALLVSDAEAPKHDLDRLPKTNYLVMHGNEDQIIDFSLGKELFAALPKPKAWIEIDGGHHTDGLSAHGGRYREEFLKIIESRPETPTAQAR